MTRRRDDDPAAAERPPMEILSAPQLAALELPEPRWAVPGLVPEGLTILAGRPKMGKSWLLLNLCAAVAAGGRALGEVQVEQGEVLYLCLEDGKRRGQARLASTMQGAPPPPALSYAFLWPTIADGAIEYLRSWLTTRPGTRLIGVDTLAKVRGEQRGDRLYDLDYAALAPFQELATAHNVAIVMVHHVRKSDAADPLELISGTFGLSGAADGALVMKRERGKADAYLYVVGRDLPEERALALGWDKQRTLWYIAGEADVYLRSQERTAILDMLREGGEPLRANDLATLLEKPDGAVRRLLWSMVRDGEVRSLGGGRYLASLTGNGGNAGNTGNTGITRNGGNGSNAAGPAGVTPVPGVTGVTGVTADDRQGELRL